MYPEIMIYQGEITWVRVRQAVWDGSAPLKWSETISLEGKKMHTATQPEGENRWKLSSDSRIFKLREMYWDKTHCEALICKPIVGSGEDTLSGHAKDFAALLEASNPFIQSNELIVGCCLAVPDNKKSINLGYYNAHYPPGHAIILNKGLKGILDEALRRLQGQMDPGRRDFLHSVAISYAAACNYVEKYADCAEKVAALEEEPKRKAELNHISAVCRDLVIGPPSSFQAALQLVQFTRIFGGRGCIGRFDQWIYPFYKKDMDAGRITAEEAQELLECLFIKLNYFGDAGAGVNNDDLRNITLAGQTPEGKDACNAVTYMCLEASAKLMLPEPKLNMRFFPGSPSRLMRESCRVLAKGTNVLAVYNDEVVIPALSRLGIPLDDVRDYCNDGCSELILGGKSTIQFTVNDSLPVLTETVLRAAEQPYESFDEVMADFKHRLTRFMPEDREPNPAITFPYFAASIEDCLQEETPKGVRYSIKGSILAQTGDTADGLAAIKKLIYEDGVLTWDELVTAIKADYEGCEPLRQMLRNRAPKFGNGNDYVDNIAKEIAEYFCDGVHERAQNPPGHGNKRAAGLMCFGMHRKRNIHASPDGRRQGDLTASSFSPAVGMDRSGPTAVLASMAKVDLSKASHGSVLDMALHPSALHGKEAFEKFVVLIEAFLKMRCTATLQMNIIDRKTLMKARENPDLPEFKTLVVRVWGFSAVFVELPADLQAHVLSRTEHGLV